MRSMKRLTILPAALLLAATAVADEVKIVEKDGVTCQEIHRTIPRTIWEHKVEKQERVINESKYTSEVQRTEHKYMAPVTEYRWEPQWVTPWNPFAAPYVTYRWVPTTRWEERTQTVATPYTRTELIPKKVTQEIPVAKARIVHETQHILVPLHARSSSANDPLSAGDDEGVVARRETGGRRLDELPPREPEWRASEGIRR